MTHHFKNPIFVALDTVDVEHAVTLAKAVGPHVGGLKIGLEFCHANGPQGMARMTELGLPVFFDLKLHDIPNTVAGGIRAVMPLGPALVNIHTSGGRAMMEAAVKAASQSGETSTWVIGVTILTSLDQDDMLDLGIARDVPDQVVALAKLAQESGLDGVVCSPLEIELIRAACGPDFKLIVPGIRPKGADVGDQKRVMTPPEAVAKGADIIVIGRPITAADDPATAAAEIAASLG